MDTARKQRGLGEEKRRDVRKPGRLWSVHFSKKKENLRTRCRSKNSANLIDRGGGDGPKGGFSES